MWDILLANEFFGILGDLIFTRLKFKNMSGRAKSIQQGPGQTYLRLVFLLKISPNCKNNASPILLHCGIITPNILVAMPIHENAFLTSMSLWGERGVCSYSNNLGEVLLPASPFPPDLHANTPGFTRGIQASNSAAIYEALILCISNNDFARFKQLLQVNNLYCHRIFIGK